VKTIEVEVKLRRKNQLTLPDEIAERLGVAPGDRLIVSLDADHPTSVALRPLLRSCAGVLKGVYGTPDEAAEYLRQERAGWGE
jgi:AbrB family looped-hinge helix DNA binding protein